MFRFKRFTIEQDLCAMKVGTDGVLVGAWASLPSASGSSPLAGEQCSRMAGELCSRILDVGTGTGVVALMLAQRYPEARVTAIDVAEGAVRQAQQNAGNSPFADRVEVLHGMVQALAQQADQQGVYDAVVSNPPFFIDSLNAPDRQRNVARHAETLTYAELMEAAWRLLSNEGELSVVVPFDYRQRMEDEATFRGFFQSRVCAVRTVHGKPAKRFLLAFRKHPCERVFEVMTLGDETYKQLTQDFYL